MKILPELSMETPRAESIGAVSTLILHCILHEESTFPIPPPPETK